MHNDATLRYELTPQFIINLSTKSLAYVEHTSLTSSTSNKHASNAEIARAVLRRQPVRNARHQTNLALCYNPLWNSNSFVKTVLKLSAVPNMTLGSALLQLIQEALILLARWVKHSAYILLNNGIKRCMGRNSHIRLSMSTVNCVSKF